MTRRWPRRSPARCPRCRANPASPPASSTRSAPLAGERFPQANLGGRWFDDVHGVGWRLVTDDPAAGDLDPALVDWLGSIGGAVVEVADTAPDLSAWFRAHDVRWALQRPDFHLYGTATDAAAAADLVEHLRRRLT